MRIFKTIFFANSLAAVLLTDFKLGLLLGSPFVLLLILSLTQFPALFKASPVCCATLCMAYHIRQISLSIILIAFRHAGIGFAALPVPTVIGITGDVTILILY